MCKTHPTWNPPLSVNVRQRDDDVIALSDALELEVGGVDAEAVQVEQVVSVAATFVQIAKLETDQGTFFKMF